MAIHTKAFKGNYIKYKPKVKARRCIYCERVLSSRGRPNLSGLCNKCMCKKFAQFQKIKMNKKGIADAPSGNFFIGLFLAIFLLGIVLYVFIILPMQSADPYGEGVNATSCTTPTTPMVSSFFYAYACPTIIFVVCMLLVVCIILLVRSLKNVEVEK